MTFAIVVGFAWAMWNHNHLSYAGRARMVFRRAARWLKKVVTLMTYLRCACSDTLQYEPAMWPSSNQLTLFCSCCNYVKQQSESNVHSLQQLFSAAPLRSYLAVRHGERDQNLDQVLNNSRDRCAPIVGLCSAQTCSVKPIHRGLSRWYLSSRRL